MVLYLGSCPGDQTFKTRLPRTFILQQRLLRGQMSMSKVNQNSKRSWRHYSTKYSMRIPTVIYLGVITVTCMCQQISFKSLPQLPTHGQPRRLPSRVPNITTGTKTNGDLTYCFTKMCSVIILSAVKY